METNNLFETFKRNNTLSTHDIGLLKQYKFVDYERLKENAYSTPNDTLTLVAYIESKMGINLPDEEWVGHDIITVALNYLKKTNQLFLIF